MVEPKSRFTDQQSDEELSGPEFSGHLEPRTTRNQAWQIEMALESVNMVAPHEQQLPIWREILFIERGG